MNMLTQSLYFSSQEQAFIASMLHETGGVYWFDLNDRESPGTYKYSDGSSPYYTHWGINQPGEARLLLRNSR